MLLEDLFNSRKKNVCENSLFIRAFAYQAHKYELAGTVAFHNHSDKTEDVIYYRASGHRRYEIAIPHELREKLRIASREGEIDGLRGSVPRMTVRQDGSFYKYPMLNYDEGKLYMISIPWAYHDSQEYLLQQRSLEKCQNDFGKNPHLLKWGDPALED